MRVTLVRLVLAGWLSAWCCAWAQDQTPPEPASAEADAGPPEASAAQPTEPPNEGAPAIDATAPELPVIPVDAPTPDVAAEPTQLDEVVVTANRRTQNVLKVPVAVTEVDGSRLEAGTIRDMRSLQLEIPSLHVSVSGSDYSGANIRMRGIGTAGSNAGFEGSVGVFVDGVFVPRPGLALADLLDIDRIEVLRGPQGTLFGKNTSVGALNLYTKKPGELGELDVTATFGSFGSKIYRVIASTPMLLDQTVGFRIAAQTNEDDGFVDNIHDGFGYNNKDRYLVRGQALVNVTDDLSLRVIADRAHRDERCCASPYTRNGPGPSRQIRDQGGTVFEPPQPYTVAFDYFSKTLVDDEGVSAAFDWRFDAFELRGLWSSRESSAEEPADADKNDLDIVYVPFQNSSAKPMSAELSVHGVAGWLDWVAGGFYSKEEIGFEQSILLGEDAAEYIVGNAGSNGELGSGTEPLTAEAYPAGSGQTLTRAFQSGDSWSVFTHNIIQLPADFELTLGLRYLEETKHGGGFSESNSPSCEAPAAPGSPANPLRVLCEAPPYEADYDDERITGTGALGYTFDGGTYVYGSYSSGFKAGGISLNPPSTTTGKYTFDPETVTAYEAGVKVPLFNHALQLRTALFKMDFEGFQLNTYDGTIFIVSNAGEVNSQGLELEGTLSGLPFTRLRGAYTFSDTVYGPGTTDAALRGKQLTNAPKHTGQMGVDFSHPFFWDGTDLVANVVGRYQSKVNTGADLNPAKEQKGFPLVNARLGLKMPADFEVSFWGANVTDQHYNIVIFNAPSQSGSFVGSVGTPRAFGIDLRKRF